MKLLQLSIKEQIEINGGGLNSPFLPIGTPMFGVMNMSSFLNQFSPSSGIDWGAVSLTPEIVTPVVVPAVSVAQSMSNSIMAEVRSMLAGLFG